MGIVSNSNIHNSPVTKVLDHLSAFPVLVDKGIGATVYNTDSNACILDFTLQDDTVMTITIPGGTGWYDVLPQFKQVSKNSSNASLSFILHIKEFTFALKS